jgi:ATP-dependent DNA ligase
VTYIRPQLAWDCQGDLKAIPRDGTWIMEPKLDGWRWQVHVGSDDLVCFGGRNGVQHPTPQWLKEALVGTVAAGSILDGELVTPGTSTDVARTDLRDQRRFVLFDVLAAGSFDTTTRTWAERRRLVEFVMGQVNRIATPLTARRILVSTVIPFGLWDEMIELIRDNHGEGVVFKRADAPYVPGGRHRDKWVKFKFKATTDAIVRDLRRGEGASNGHRVGALVVTLVETGCQTTVGWDGSWVEGAAMLERRIEIQHYGWQPSGKVRHPGFLRTREDLETTHDKEKEGMKR